MHVCRRAVWSKKYDVSVAERSLVVISGEL